jgi:steroid delta-isomerase-like uncharacterized protein
MSEINIALAKKWFEEVWNKSRRDAIAEMLAPDAILEEGDDVTRGPEAFYPFFDRMQAAFSNAHVAVQDALADGDKVCLRWTFTAKHTGNGLGLPATGEQVKVTGISIVRIKDGKLVHGWQNWDMLGMLAQIREEPKAPTYVAMRG